MDDCLCDETQFPPMSDFPDDPDELLVTYLYEIRGWITRINGFSMLLDEPSIEEEKQLLAEGLLFNCDYTLQVTCWYLAALANIEQQMKHLRCRIFFAGP